MLLMELFSEICPFFHFYLGCPQNIHGNDFQNPVEPLLDNFTDCSLILSCMLTQNNCCSCAFYYEITNVKY